MGVARLVRARQRLPRMTTTPSGSTGTSASPSSPMRPSRPTVGVENRARTNAGTAATKNASVASTTRISSHQGTWRRLDPP